MDEAIPFTIYPSLRDKHVLITGGAEGIGAATVELLAKQGSKVTILDISTEAAHALIAKVQNQSVNQHREGKHWLPSIYLPKFYECNVCNLDQLQNVARQVLQNEGPVECLINNAAAAGANARRPSVEVTPESWEFDVNVNLRHIFFLTQAVLPSMQKQGKGSIINMGSISWKIPSVGVPVYATCKAAILGLTKTHSKEYGKYNIRVNSVMPGSIATQRQINEVLTPEYRAEVMAAQSLKRDLMPEEVARVILFLASDDSSAVTGSSYVVDGGWVSDL